MYAVPPDLLHSCTVVIAIVKASLDFKCGFARQFFSGYMDIIILYVPQVCEISFSLHPQFPSTTHQPLASITTYYSPCPLCILNYTPPSLFCLRNWEVDPVQSQRELLSPSCQMTVNKRTVTSQHNQAKLTDAS